jgi:hypothetical protein
MIVALGSPTDSTSRTPPPAIPTTVTGIPVVNFDADDVTAVNSSSRP